MVAPPWVPVPPPRYGGTELVVDALARGLKAMGHEVVLFASGDSTCPVELHSVYQEALGTQGSAEEERNHVEAAYRYFAGRVDVIHDNTLVGPERLLPLAGTTPVVHTNHGPFTEENIPIYERVARKVPVIAISRSQADAAPSVAVEGVIYHGMDMSKVVPGRGDGGYVAFLGRMNPEKGAHRAILAAREAGVSIRLAAKMWEPAERAYFAREVEPLLGDDAIYVGEVGGTDKYELLGGAIALMNPIRWREPFGLTMIEAMAAGTPVLAFREGSAPEVVEDGVTGYLCEDVHDMAAKIARARAMSRAGVRARAVRRFSLERMVEDHVRLYRSVLARSTRTPKGSSPSVATPSEVRSMTERLAAQGAAAESDADAMPAEARAAG